MGSNGIIWGGGGYHQVSYYDHKYTYIMEEVDK